MFEPPDLHNEKETELSQSKRRWQPPAQFSGTMCDQTFLKQIRLCESHILRSPRRPLYPPTGFAGEPISLCSRLADVSVSWTSTAGAGLRFAVCTWIYKKAVCVVDALDNHHGKCQLGLRGCFEGPRMGNGVRRHPEGACNIGGIEF